MLIYKVHHAYCTLIKQTNKLLPRFLEVDEDEEEVVDEERKRRKGETRRKMKVRAKMMIMS